MNYLILLLLLILSCNTGSSNSIEISNAWIREVPAESGITALYFDIQNSGNTEDIIVSINTPFSEKAEIHNSVIDDDGTAKMVKIEEVTIATGDKIRFAPGGMHVMLIGLSKDINAGEEYEFNIIFQKEGKKTLKAKVKGLEESMMDKMNH